MHHSQLVELVGPALGVTHRKDRGRQSFVGTSRVGWDDPLCRIYAGGEFVWRQPYEWRGTYIKDRDGEVVHV